MKKILFLLLIIIPSLSQAVLLREQEETLESYGITLQLLRDYSKSIRKNWESALKSVIESEGIDFGKMTTTKQNRLFFDEEDTGKEVFLEMLNTDFPSTDLPEVSVLKDPIRHILSAITSSADEISVTYPIDRDPYNGTFMINTAIFNMIARETMIAIAKQFKDDAKGDKKAYCYDILIAHIRANFKKFEETIEKEIEEEIVPAGQSSRCDGCMCEDGCCKCCNKCCPTCWTGFIKFWAMCLPCLERTNDHAIDATAAAAPEVIAAAISAAIHAAKF